MDIVFAIKTHKPSILYLKIKKKFSLSPQTQLPVGAQPPRRLDHPLPFSVNCHSGNDLPHNDVVVVSRVTTSGTYRYHSITATTTRPADHRCWWPPVL